MFKQNIAFIAVKRYISNILLDNEKQRALWVFLGEFTPFRDENSEDIWDINPSEIDCYQKILNNAIMQYINILTEGFNVSPGILPFYYLRNKYLKGWNGSLCDKIPNFTSSEIVTKLEVAEKNQDSNLNKKLENEENFDQKIDENDDYLKKNVLKYFNDYHEYLKSEKEIWEGSGLDLNL